jgi:hypothetical protein
MQEFFLSSLASTSDSFLMNLHAVFFQRIDSWLYTSMPASSPGHVKHLYACPFGNRRRWR